AKSQEVNTWFIIAAGTLNIMAFSGPMGSDLQTTFRGLLANAHSIALDGRSLINMTGYLGLKVLAATALPFLVLMLAAIAGNMVQHRLVWSSESLMPKLSKISPMAGFKRLFSKQALANLVKGLLKLAIVGTVMVLVMWPERHHIDGLVTIDPVAIMAVIRSWSLNLLGAVVAVFAFIAALDFFWQYRQWYERQKMSLQEIKDEFKQTEGDPTIKAKIRQLRQTRARKRMMAAVPQASVVITNPTHYAIALKYERGMNAPVCVAKGIDLIALKIREVAGQHNIPIVENPPLARALHATVEIDQEIPDEHYKAVAEVIGYVMRLKRGFRS
ncbi:MAG TPA: flagellar biosynthesis protein FlhB, partial [Xanthobacteraceae bacterium]|nr:flagellar biosynthesis protein FlhB [Xanthobacteraceae bacterium]